MKSPPRRSRNGRVIVVGGGAVGLCVAESLAHLGAEVTVFERDRCGGGASAGNAGWITPSLAIPIPGPGVISQSLRWLLHRSGPLWIRPTLSPGMLAWLARFVASCTRPTYRRGLAALQCAAALAGESFDRLAERGVLFELRDGPLLYPAFEHKELGHLLKVATELQEAGSTQRLDRLSAAEFRSLEPALGQGLLGGLVAHGERTVRPERFTAAVHSALLSRGVEVLEHSPVTALIRSGADWVVECPTATRRAGAVVLAGGVASAELLAGHGIRLPIVGAKGYSRTYPADPGGPRHAMYLEGPKVAISVFDSAIRVAGTLELGAKGLGFSSRRLTAIADAAQRAMPGWRMPPRARDWAGMRSLSPDGLPMIGAVPGLDGIHLATGHATLGVTLAPLTGELIAQLLLEPEPSELLTAFDPARTWRRP